MGLKGVAVLALVVGLVVAGMLWMRRSEDGVGQAVVAPGPVADPPAAPQPRAEPEQPWPPADLGLSPHILADKKIAFAVRSMEAAFRSRPTVVRRVRELGQFLMMQHEYRAARPLLEWLAEHDPEKAAPLGLLGLVWIRLGRLEQAAAAFERSIAADPNDWSPLLYLGRVAFRRQDVAGALGLVRRAVELGGDDAYPQHDLGILLLLSGEPALALAPLQAAVAGLRDDPGPPFDLMNAYRALGRPVDEARVVADYWRRFRGGGSGLPVWPTVAAAAPQHAGTARFVNVAPLLGLDNRGRGRASASVDIDGDGDVDILAGNLEQRSRFYRNEGGGTRWVEVSDEAGLGWFDSGYGHAFADYDNDGDLDLYVTRGGFQRDRPGRDANLLFRNDGGGRFSDVTERAGVGDTGMGFSGVWGDLDGDGFVDLYVANYFNANRLYRNRGDGTFEDFTRLAGVGDVRSGVSAVLFDYDDDGDLDIYAANSGDASALYRNEGGFHFTDVSVVAGVAVDAGFASVAADFDNDGDLDLYVTGMNNWYGGDNFGNRTSCKLLLNRGDGTFEDATDRAGVGYIGGPMGLGAGDWDYDGHVDLLLGNGGPEPHRWEPDIAYRNLGGGQEALVFANVTDTVGLRNRNMGHGISFADYDRDGDLDIYVSNGAHVGSDSTPNLFWRNEGHGHHWLVVELVGTRSNRAAIGARATLYAGEHVQAQEVSGGAGFGSQNSLELEFGLGPRTSVDRVEIRWPTGVRQTLTSPPIDRFLRVTEGTEGWTPMPSP